MSTVTIDGPEECTRGNMQSRGTGHDTYAGVRQYGERQHGGGWLHLGDGWQAITLAITFVEVTPAW